MLNTMQSNTYGIRTELIPLIETFDYLSGRANGERIYINEQEACERHPYLRKKIKEILRKGIEFEKELDEAVHVDESELQYFFKDLSTHCSIARMLIMPYTFMGEARSGKFFFEELLNMNPQQRIKKMCCHMQNFDSSQNFDYESLVEYVMKLPISGMNKLSIVECCSNYEQNCMRLERFMSPIVKIVDEKLVRFEEDVKKWERDIQEVGDVCTYVSEHSRLKMPKCDFTIFPSIHNGLMLAMSYWDKRICIGEKGCAGEMWLGLGFRDYMESVSNESSTSRVVGIFSGLSDEIRFEILKAIAQRKTMSGGEIADKFGLTRQKVFYHMSKLLTLGLVECNAESGRPYYSLKKQSLEEVIAAISMLVNED